MMGREAIFYIYGLCTMFYAMMAWMFGTHGRERLWRLVTLLMAVICLECFKDVFFLEGESYGSDWEWIVVTAMDMVAVPLYGFILRELCKPGQLTWRRAIAEEVPFVALPIILVCTHNKLFYDIEVAWAAIYGTYYAVWTFIAIPRYHRQLKERFSYTENINLNWLRTILLVFIVLIVLWTVDSMLIDMDVESLYMMGSMVAWMFICWFLYRHESVINELEESEATGTEDEDSNTAKPSDIGIKIEHLMLVKRVYLNPRLKLSEVAADIHSNRTYVSNWFNNERHTTFFDYVNALRVEHACTMLKTTKEPIDVVAHASGFNSISAFYRLFRKLMGITPADYRESKCIPEQQPISHDVE